MEAPDDDRWVLAWHDTGDGDHWTRAWHDGDGWHILEESGGFARYGEGEFDEPTKWREVPAPPDGSSPVSQRRPEGLKLEIDERSITLWTWGQAFECEIPVFNEANAHLQREAPETAWRHLGESLVRFLRKDDTGPGSSLSVSVPKPEPTPVSTSKGPWIFPDFKPEEFCEVYYWHDGWDNGWDTCDSESLEDGDLWCHVPGKPETPSAELIKRSADQLKDDDDE